MALHTVCVPAAELRLGDLVVAGEGPARRVVLHRLEWRGRPVAVIGWAGWPGPHVYPAGERVLIARRAAAGGGGERS